MGIGFTGIPLQQSLALCRCARCEAHLRPMPPAQAAQAAPSAPSIIVRIQTSSRIEYPWYGFACSGSTRVRIVPNGTGSLRWSCFHHHHRPWRRKSSPSTTTTNTVTTVTTIVGTTVAMLAILSIDLGGDGTSRKYHTCHEIVGSTILVSHSFAPTTTSGRSTKVGGTSLPTLSYLRR